MNTRLRHQVAAICCALALSSPAAHSETLLEIFEQAVQNDHQFQAAHAELQAGLENKNLGRAALLPQVGGDASISKSRINNRGRADIIVPGDETPDVIADGDIPERTEPRTVEYSVSLRQSIIDLSSWHGYSRGKALANVAEAEFAAAEQALVLRTANAYFTALQAVDNLETAQAEEEALSQQLEQTNQRFEVGLTAITEVHEAQAAFDSATANRLVAAGNLGIAFEALEVLTGQPYQSLSPLANDFPVAPPQPVERETWVELAMDNNPTLKSAWFFAESVEANAKARRADHLPTLSGAITYGDTESTYDGITLTDRDAATVSLNLNVPLFAGGGTSASRRQAAYEHVSAREQFRQTQRDVVQAARSNHLAVLTTAATVKARRQAITSNQSALEATQAGYDVGTRDLVDVLNAQGNLFRAQRDYYDALYSYVLATLELRQAAGVLSADDIVALNEWLDTSRAADYKRG